MLTYYAIVHQEGDSAFGVTFPDLPGCFSAADDEADVLRKAQEAVSLYVADLLELPSARTLRELRADPSLAGDFRDAVFIIAVPLIAMSQKARYNVVMDASLVAGIDDAAKTVGVSRSEFISRTMQERLASEAAVVIAPNRATSASTRVPPRTSNVGRQAARPARVLADATVVKTGKQSAAAAASKVLRDPKASKDAKTAAASALTQKVKAKKK